jgi:serine/threonine-protein kinase
MKELGFNNGSSFMVIVDIRQPGEQYDAGLYQDGPVVGRFVKQYMSRQFLPEGTLLHGRLWTTGISVDVYREGLRPGVIGRYTQAVLPDGRSYPVCIVMGNDDGRVLKQQGSTPELTVLGRSMPMSAVWRWP